MVEAIEVTILMPCLNEAETLGACIKKAKAWMSHAEVSAEILIADNGSTDGSQKIATKAGATVINVPTKGYGAAISAGVAAAKGKYIIMGDSDDSYDFSKLGLFLKDLREGKHLVMGNRFLGGIEPGAMPWKNKHIGNPILSYIGRKLFTVPVSDFHCGLRGFSKLAFMQLDLKTTGMEFASEMVIRAGLLGMQISEVPTTLSKDGRTRPPHLRPWRDGWRHLRFMLTMSPIKLLLVPGIAVQTLLTAPFLFFLFGPIRLGDVVFSYNSFILVQAGIYLGFLSTLIGITLQTIAEKKNLSANSRKMRFFQKSGFLDTLGFLG